MDQETRKFLRSEVLYGSQLDPLLHTLLPLINIYKYYELKTLSEYFNIQIKKQVLSADCYKDIIDVYFKQMIYFDMLKNAILCGPYIIRALQEISNLNKEIENDIRKMLKNIRDHPSTYEEYFDHLLNDVDLEEFEKIKIRLLCKYFQAINEEIEKKVRIGYIINEMITREATYITNLKSLLEAIKYHAPIKKDKIIGQMDKIYEGHKKLLHDLQQLDWNCDTIKFIECYEKHIVVFHLYAEDQRSNKAEVVNTLPQAFRDDLRNKNVDFYMCIKHLMFYSPFFEKVIELEPEKSACIAAKEFNKKIVNVNRSADDTLAVANILHSNIDLYTIGNLMSRGKARYLKREDHELFIFENALVITEVPNDKTTNQLPNAYRIMNYKNHIMKELLDISIKKDKLKIITAPYYGADIYTLQLQIHDNTFQNILLSYAGVKENY